MVKLNTSFLVIAHLRAIPDILKRHGLVVIFVGLPSIILFLIFILKPDLIILEKLLRRRCFQ